jgi:hypothetical protein
MIRMILLVHRQALPVTSAYADHDCGATSSITSQTSNGLSRTGFHSAELMLSERR